MALKFQFMFHVGDHGVVCPVSGENNQEMFLSFLRSCNHVPLIK